MTILQEIESLRSCWWGFEAHEDDYADAEQKCGAFDFFGEGMEALEVEASRVGGWGGVDVAACGDAVAFHCGDDGGLKYMVAAIIRMTAAACAARSLRWRGLDFSHGWIVARRKSRPQTMAELVENAQGCADDEAGFVSGGQDAEGGWGEDEGEEDEAADPDSDGDEAKDTEECGHDRASLVAAVEFARVRARRRMRSRAAFCSAYSVAVTRPAA